MKLNQELQELTSKKELDRQNLVLSLKESKYCFFFLIEQLGIFSIGCGLSDAMTKGCINMSNTNIV